MDTLGYRLAEARKNCGLTQYFNLGIVCDGDRKRFRMRRKTEIDRKTFGTRGPGSFAPRRFVPGRPGTFFVRKNVAWRTTPRRETDDILTA